MQKAKPTAYRKRKKEISVEMKELAAQKKKSITMVTGARNH